jgi:hypothetical protein
MDASRNLGERAQKLCILLLGVFMRPVWFSVQIPIISCNSDERRNFIVDTDWFCMRQELELHII